MRKNFLAVFGTLLVLHLSKDTEMIAWWVAMIDTQSDSIQRTIQNSYFPKKFKMSRSARRIQQNMHSIRKPDSSHCQTEVGES